MPGDFDAHVKTADEAIMLLAEGNVTHISFDHDLGTGNGDGYEVAKYIATSAFFNSMPPLEWSVHSANPVGRKNIIDTMENAEKFWRFNSKG